MYLESLWLSPYGWRRPDKMAEWIECTASVLGDRAIQTSPVRTKVESNKWLENLNYLPPRQSQGIFTIAQGLGWFSVRIMWLSGCIKSWYWWPCLPVEQHYKVAVGAHCYKSVPILIWTYMLPGHKTTNKTPVWVTANRLVTDSTGVDNKSHTVQIYSPGRQPPGGYFVCLLFLCPSKI